MDPTVTAVVLLSALMHASWNAFVKGAADGLVTQAAIVAGAAAYAVPFLFFVPFPNAEAWFYLALSAVIHCGYFAALATGYSIGDLGVVYPIARGSAPIIVTGLSALLIGEVLSLAQFASVLVICLGLFALTMSRHPGGDKRPILFAALIAATIAAYSMTDGIGVRVAGNPYAYIPWLLFVQAFPFLGFLVWRRGNALVTLARGQGQNFFLGGFLVGASYGLAMWAFCEERVAVVMALRETSVIFGAVIGAVIFREAFGKRRIFAAVLIAIGAVALNLAH